MTVLAKKSLETEPIDLKASQVSQVQSNLAAPKIIEPQAKILIKPVPKTSTASNNKAQISVIDVKKNQRVRVTVRSK